MNVKSVIENMKLCEKCKTNYVYLNKEYCLQCLSEIEEEKKKKDKVEHPEKYMKLWNFPIRFLNWEKQHLLKHFQNLLDDIIQNWDKYVGLYLTGSAGSGKTCFVCVLAKELIKQNKVNEIYFINTTEFFFEIKSTFDKETKIFNDYDLIKKYAEKEYLILDDVGAEKITEYVRQSFYVLVNKRYLNNLFTIITSNYTIDDLSKVFDDRIASRLSEMCKVVDLGNIDLRTQKNKLLRP